MRFLFAFLSLINLGVMGDTPISIPLKYNMAKESVILKPEGKQTVMAHLSCPSMENAKVQVCAELPRNWEWAADQGFVYLNIFNTSTTTDLTMAIASTGRPQTGVVAVPCVTIKQWPGGDMYIRVDSNNYAPVVYVLSATVTTVPTPEPRTALTSQRALSQKVGHADPNGTPIKMVGSAVLAQSLKLTYKSHITLSIDLCYDMGPPPVMKTSIIAKSGTLIHYLCKGLPCTPDSVTVRCSSASPMPVESCHAQFNPGIEKAYVHISAAGGAKQPNNTFVAEFMFAASFEKV